MMKINGTNGANTQIGQMGMNQATDSYSKNIRNQIVGAQKQLQELSSNEDMTLEEKMKKRQEIQQQISDLNTQLRQRQIEQRREKRQAKGSSMDDMPGGAGNTRSAKAGGKNAGLSQVSMTAMISADSSMKQAKVQGSVATSMEGRAGVLEAEIRQDAGSGADVEKKQEELADVTQKAQAATASQMNTLAEANKAMEEAAAAEQGDNRAAGAKEENTAEKTAESGADGEKAQDGVSGAGSQAGAAENVQRDDSTQAENAQPVETAVPEAATAQAATYTHVDVRL